LDSGSTYFIPLKTKKHTIMKTTFQKIKDCKPCGDGWDQLISYHNPSSLDEEISIEEIIKSNGLNDATWALRAVDNTEALTLLSIEAAEFVLPIYEKRFPGDMRVRDCIDACKKYVRGEISRYELIEKKDSAASAAAAVHTAAYAACAAAHAAVHTACANYVAANAIRAVRDTNTAVFAARAVARAAACAADNSGKGREAIKDILLKY
jgi:hypothetical protein